MEDSTNTPSEQGGVTDAVRAQILATEHWSLLATRSMTWNETFSRASMFLTVLSGALVTLALVGNATGFGPSFRNFALLVLPVVLLIGLVTYSRLSDANVEDIGLLLGMNRLRHAYLKIAPDLEPYFVTSHYDDELGVIKSYGLGAAYSPVRALTGTPELIALIDAVLAGVIATLMMEALGVGGGVKIAVGVVSGIAVAALLGAATLRRYTQMRRNHQPRFPSPGENNTKR